MIVDHNKIVGIFLENDELLNLYAIVHHSRVWGDVADEKLIRTAVHQLTSQGVLIEFDPESEALDDALIDHNDHGTLDPSELTYLNIETFYALGPKAVVFIDNNKSSLLELSISAGLSRAVNHLRNLRIDSSDWTGLPNNFEFTPEVQAKVIKLLQEAEFQLEKSIMGNESSAQAKAYIRSALILAEAPEPQPDMIAEILRRIRMVAGIVGFLSSLTGLFTIFAVKN